MPLKKISAEDALASLSHFSAIIDARSESEYALDRLPGALNWPTLTDEERHRIGTEYVQIGGFEAKSVAQRWPQKTSPRILSAR